MFQLNLIKDKAKARQRRRIVLLSVVSIVFLAGLFSIFVVMMTLTERTRTELEKTTATRLDSDTNQLKARLDNEEGAARDRKNMFKEAWEEDRKLLNDRVFLAPVFSQLAQYRPARGQFWYSSMAVSLLTQPALAGQPPKSPLVASREFSGAGVVQIVDSDIVTQDELTRVGRQISESAVVTQTVGVPQFTLSFDGDTGARGGATAGRYARFIVRARRESGD